MQSDNWLLYAGRVALALCLILSLVVFKLSLLPNTSEDNTATVLNSGAPERKSNNPNKNWLTEGEAIKAGLIQPHGQILELAVDYNVESLPALTIVSGTRLNGYTPNPELAEGRYTVALLDKRGSTLFEMPFDIPTVTDGPPPIAENYALSSGGKVTDVSSSKFALTLPWYARASEAILFDEFGYEIHSFNVTGVPFENNIPRFMTLPGEKVLEKVEKEQISSQDTNNDTPIFGALIPVAHAQTVKDTYRVLFIGDKYTASNMAQFYTDADRFAAKLVSLEPFKTRASQITFHTIENTQDLGCTYDSSMGRLLTCNTYTVSSIVNKAGVPWDSIAVIVNSSTYGGSGGSISVAYNGSNGPAVFVHELAHSFGRLIDEYLLYSTNGYLTGSPNYNCYPGNPPAQAWVQYNPTYYQGCNYPNWYRSSQTSLMREITANYFNPVSMKYLNDALDRVAGSFSSDSQPPTVSLSSPESGATLAGAVTLSTSATDNVGISRVEFTVDSQVVGSDSTAPYTITWQSTQVQNGSHTFNARAYDTSGNTATSPDVAATVSNTVDNSPPIVTITSPLSGSTVSGGVAVAVTATDDSGAIQAVTFLVDGVEMFSTQVAPYDFSWNTAPVANGNHTIAVRATDGSGNLGNATPVSVNVQNAGDTTSPSVTIVSPVNGTVFDGKGSTNVSAMATDDRAVVGMTILLDGAIIGSCTTNQCTASINEQNLTAGTHTVTATAVDAAQNQDSVTITVSKSTSGKGGNTGGKGRVR